MWKGGVDRGASSVRDIDNSFLGAELGTVCLKLDKESMLTRCEL